MEGDDGEGGTGGGRLRPHQVGPPLGAQEGAVLAPRLDPVGHGGGDGAAAVGAGQGADDPPAGGGAPAPVVRRRGGPPGGAVLGEPHHVPGRPCLLEQRHPEPAVQHQRVVVGRAPPHRLAHEQARVRAGARVPGVRPHARRRAGQALAPDAAHAGDEAQRDGGEGFPRGAVVMGGRTPEYYMLYTRGLSTSSPTPDTIPRRFTCRRRRGLRARSSVHVLGVPDGDDEAGQKAAGRRAPRAAH